MVLHRPVETTALIGEVESGPRSDVADVRLPDYTAKWPAVPPRSSEQIRSSASFTRDLRRSGQECGNNSAGGSEGQPQSRNRAIPRQVDQVSADRGRKTAEHGRGQAIGERESRSTNIDGHDLCEENNHGAVVAAVEK